MTTYLISICDLCREVGICCHKYRHGIISVMVLVPESWCALLPALPETKQLWSAPQHWYHGIVCGISNVFLFFSNNVGMSEIIYFRIMLCLYCLLTPIMLAMLLIPFNAHNSSNTMFSPIALFGQISSGPMNLFSPNHCVTP